jgi:acetylornithine deacetylase/succinyl-diaminopimelate desuccinylase-like protein
LKKRKIGCAVFLVSVLLAVSGSADNGKADRKPVPERQRIGFETIRPEESLAYMEFLAADELEGRDTASVGQAVARNYIRSLYKIWGVEPAGDKKGNGRTYEQKIDMVEKVFGPETTIEIQTESGRAVYAFGEDFSGSLGVDVPGTITAQAVFAGYGLSAPDLGYDDFAGLDVRGKIVVVSTGKPGGEREDSPFNLPENLARFAGRRTPAENCARLLADKGAAALLLVDEAFGRVSNPGGYIQGGRIRSDSKRVTALKLSTVDRMVPFFWVSASVADSLFASSPEGFAAARERIDRSLEPNSFEVPGADVEITLDIRRKYTVCANLLGKIEGSDPELKKEYVIIGAHLDHVGMNEDGYVFNGADDNASGSAGVLQAAKAFALNPEKPRRTILFAHWTGEEKGLLGSAHFVHFSTVPLDNIVACINLDMICTDTPMANIERGIEEYAITPEELSAFEEDPDTLLAAITSLQSPDMVDHYTRISRDYVGLQPVPLCSAPMPGNSDHWHFARRNIPSVFFFTTGNGHAHQPTDTVEKADAGKMSRVVRLAYLTAFQIADTEARPGWE